MMVVAAVSFASADQPLSGIASANRDLVVVTVPLSESLRWPLIDVIT